MKLSNTFSVFGISRKLFGQITYAILVLTMLVPSSMPGVAQALVPVRNATASITPSTAVAGTTQTFSMVFSNSLSSTEDMKSMRVTLPSGYLVVAPLSLSLSSSTDTASNWSVATSSINVIDVSLNTGSDGIDPGDSITVNFSAKIGTSTGAVSFTAAASKNSSFSSGGGAAFIVSGSTSVTVTPAPANTAPVITLLGLPSVTLTVGDTYTDAGATAMDTEDGDITGSIVTSSSVNTAIAGTYSVTYDVTDSGGLAATQVARTVIVNPPVNNAPVITRLGSASVVLTVGDTYTDAGATAADTEDGDITASIVLGGSVDTATAGTYILTYDVTDSGGLAATQVTRTVIVNPSVPGNTAPSVTLVGADPLILTIGDTYTDPGATASDVEDGDLTSSIVVTGTVDTATLGTYTITYTVTDSGGLSGAVSRTVTVNPVSNSDVSITKTVDNTSPKGGDTITYTLTATNAGPDTATNVSVSDVLTAGITFSSAATADGTISESGGTVTWNIGSIANGATAVATIKVTVNTNNAGGTINNSATIVADQKDSNSGNNSGSAPVVTVAPDTTTPPSTGGGGHGSTQYVGGGSTGGQVLGAFADSATLAGQQALLGAAGCSEYIKSFIRLGANNKADDVTRLQTFLNTQYPNLGLPVTGEYDRAWFDAVKTFQVDHNSDVLQPWIDTGWLRSTDGGTGYVYLTTRWTINSMMCPSLNVPKPIIPQYNKVSTEESSTETIVTAPTTGADVTADSAATDTEATSSADTSDAANLVGQAPSSSSSMASVIGVLSLGTGNGWLAGLVALILIVVIGLLIRRFAQKK